MEDRILEETDYLRIVRFVEDFTANNGYIEGSIALNIVRELLPDEEFASFKRSIDMCTMLINLQIGLPLQDGDVILSAALCSSLPGIKDDKDLAERLVGECGISERALKIARMIIVKSDLPDSEMFRWTSVVEQDRLALLLVLADRGNLMSRLHEVSSWTAHQYIYETRSFYFPMCFHGRENYPELHAPISVLLEKMKCLIEVTEVFLAKYESRENELVRDILSLQSENTTMKSLIRRAEAVKA